MAHVPAAGALPDTEAEPLSWARQQCVLPRALGVALVGNVLLAIGLSLLAFMADTQRSVGKPALLVDTDAGLDDLFALAFLFGSAPDMEVPLITTVRGISRATQGACIVQQLLETLGQKDTLVVSGAPEPSAGGHVLEELDWGRQYTAEAPDLLKVVGLTQPGNPLDEASSSTAATALLSTVRQHCGRCSLLCIGPLTNVAAALDAQPGTLQRCVTSVVVMGGAVRVAGNVQPGAASEFNFWCDPMAARRVVQANLPLVMLDLGVANPEALPSEAQGQITSLPAISPVAQIMRQLLMASPESGAYDPTAVAYVLRPDLFRTERIWIRVKADGATVESSPQEADGQVTLVSTVQRHGYAHLVRAAYTGS
eukprot:GGOE01036820.1.p1 GENE.GGOE01036820.1~~GGOE01036820.1.p1  ORF type:complete len:368 (-),score=85.71 GGOE01036820.1:234-1337(-)